MPKVFAKTKPYLLGQPDNISQGEALYNSGLTGDSIYEAFDICELDAQGRLTKAITTTGAATRYCMANKDWNQPFAKQIYRDRPEWIRLFGLDDNVVFQLSVAWDETLRGALRNLVFNATDKVLEIGNVATNAAVKILYPIYESTESTNPDGLGFGAPQQARVFAGDTKVPVLCRFVEGKVL